MTYDPCPNCDARWTTRRPVPGRPDMTIRTTVHELGCIGTDLGYDDEPEDPEPAA